MRPGAIVEGERGIGRKLDSPRVVGDGLVEREPFAFGIAAVDVGVCRARIELDGLVQIGNGAIGLAFGEEGAAPIVLGRGRRIELDGLIVIGNRVIKIAFAAPRDGAIVERHRVVWIDP